MKMYIYLFFKIKKKDLGYVYRTYMLNISAYLVILYYINIMV